MKFFAQFLFRCSSALLILIDFSDRLVLRRVLLRKCFLLIFGGPFDVGRGAIFSLSIAIENDEIIMPIV